MGLWVLAHVENFTVSRECKMERHSCSLKNRLERRKVMVFKRAAVLLSLVAGARQPINGRERRAAPRSCVQRSSRKNLWTGGAAMFFIPFSSGLAPPFGVQDYLSSKVIRRFIRGPRFASNFSKYDKNFRFRISFIFQKHGAQK